MDERNHIQPDPPAGQHGLPLRGLTPRHVAQTIYGLQSRLVSLVYTDHNGQPALVYTFEVAGKVKSFRTAVVPEELELDQQPVSRGGGAGRAGPDRPRVAAVHIGNNVLEPSRRRRHS